MPSTLNIFLIDWNQMRPSSCVHFGITNLSLSLCHSFQRHPQKSKCLPNFQYSTHTIRATKVLQGLLQWGHTVCCGKPATTQPSFYTSEKLHWILLLDKTCTEMSHFLVTLGSDSPSLKLATKGELVLPTSYSKHFTRWCWPCKKMLDAGILPMDCLLLASPVKHSKLPEFSECINSTCHLCIQRLNKSSRSCDAVAERMLRAVLGLVSPWMRDHWKSHQVTLIWYIISDISLL